MVRVEINEKEFKEIAETILDSICDKLLTTIKTNTIEANAIATGYYYRSFEKRDEDEYSKSVGSTSPIAKYVEWGTRPHRPPYEAIYKWVLAKKGETGEEAREAAWKIISKIAREGTKEKLILTKSVVDTVRELGGSGYETFIRRGKSVGAWREVKTGRFSRSV